MIKKIIYYILKFFNLINEEEIKENEETMYFKKQIMSEYENKFYNILKELKNDYEIIPQLNLASVIEKKSKNKYYNELFRNIDFAIFTKDYKELLLLIEINDKTHNKMNRKDRDLKVKKICNEAGIKIINFYTCYPNEKDYVINRILKEINNGFNPTSIL
ncbi:MAG: DUF2726 domain-containing protein [Bacilli bacterium]